MKSQQIQWIYTAVLGLVEQWVSTGAMTGVSTGAMGIYWSNGYLLEQWVSTGAMQGAMGIYWSIYNGYLLEQWVSTCLQGQWVLTLHYSQIRGLYILRHCKCSSHNSRDYKALLRELVRMATPLPPFQVALCMST